MPGKFPDFFIVGAPKCGTTSLFRYLTQHPSIYASAVKEPNFFCTDFPTLSKFPSLENYLELFAGAADDQTCGEASPWYLLSEVAVDKILRHNPNAKFIVLLRNPADAITSYFRYMRYYLVEEREDILGAMLLQNTRPDLPTGIRHRHANPFLKYQEIFAYAGQIERIRHKVPDHNLLVLFFEEFFRDPAAGLDKVFTFLDLPSCTVDLAHHNPAQEWKYDLIRRVLVSRYSPRFLQNRLADVSKFFRKRGLNINRMFLAKVTKQGGRLNQDPIQRSTLARFFQEDVHRLRKMVDVPNIPEWALD